MEPASEMAIYQTRHGMEALGKTGDKLGPTAELEDHINTKKSIRRQEPKCRVKAQRMGELRVCLVRESFLDGVQFHEPCTQAEGMSNGVCVMGKQRKDSK